MRISTSMIYDSGLTAIQNNTADIVKTQREVATGRAILTPADDPIGAARILEMGQSQDVVNQFDRNLGFAEDSLRHLEGTLSNATDVLQYARERMVQAGNGALTQSELTNMGFDLRNQFESLRALANSRNGQGEYIFAGYRSNTEPFQGDLTGVSYNGDQGGRTIQVTAARFMPTSLAGDEVFDRTRTVQAQGGATPYTSDAIYTYAGQGNTGTAQNVQVNLPAATLAAANTNLDALEGRRFIATWSGAAWAVEEVRPGNTRVATTLAAENLGITVGSGTPAAGDAFDIFVASTNVFDNFALGISALEDNSPVGQQGGVAFALEHLDHGIETLSDKRAQVGSQLVETEQLMDLGDELNIQYEEAISRFEDVDYNEAISNLTRQQAFLTAAQQSYLRVTNLSLFNFIN